MQVIKPDEKMIYGAISFERGAGFLKPWRIPFEQAELFPPNAMNGSAETAAGIRLELDSDTTRIELAFIPVSKERTLDCYIDGQFQESRRVAKEAEGVSFSDLPARMKRITVYFAQNAPIQLCGVTVDDSASYAYVQMEQPRWIAYGSSITQCASAATTPPPSRTWPAIVARERGLALTCLGYGGNCHMEPMVARMIRDLPAEMISLCLGINVYGANSFSPRTFLASVIGFIQIIREKHARTPILVISPIFSPEREEQENAVGFTLKGMREELEKAVQLLNQHGDQQLFFIHGLDLLSERHAHHLPDKLHPDPDGYEIMAGHFIEKLDRLGLWTRISSI